MLECRIIILLSWHHKLLSQCIGHKIVHQRGPPFKLLRGIVKLKNFQKSEKNSDCPDNTHPPAYPIFIFWKHVQRQKQHKKQNISKKKKSEWGLTHPPTSEFFSDFLIFLNLTKPLRAGARGLEYFYFVQFKNTSPPPLVIEWRPPYLKVVYQFIWTLYLLNQQ